MILLMFRKNSKKRSSRSTIIFRMECLESNDNDKLCSFSKWELYYWYRWGSIKYSFRKQSWYWNEYDTFKMIVEVTLSSGNTQFNMEGESVARHFGTMQNNSDKPVFCFFYCSKISDGALAHFFLNRLNTRAYGLGKQNFLPMTVSNFVKFITTAKDTNFQIQKFFIII